jgi:hypothetical protein
VKCTLEVRTTISPTPYFFRRIHYMAASLRAIGSRLANHELVVSVGGSSPRENLYRSQPWSNRYPILWRWVRPEAYARAGYRATNDDRAWHMSRADFVMIADADVLFMRDFTELLESIEDSPAICGVMAHISPFISMPPISPPWVEHVATDARPDVLWRLLGDSFGLHELPLEHEYSGWQCMFTTEGHQFAPAYFNGGMIVGPGDLMDRLFSLYPAAEAAVDSVMETGYRPQLARTLAIYKAGLPRRVLPVRYNFPNDPGFDAKYADELSNIYILHYQRTDVVHRDTDFETAESTARLVARSDLRGSNELLRRRLTALHATVVEEEMSAGATRSAAGASPSSRADRSRLTLWRRLFTRYRS